MSSVTAKTTYLVTQTGFSHLSHWTGNGDIFAPLRFSSCVENGHMHAFEEKYENESEKKKFHQLENFLGGFKLKRKIYQKGSPKFV